jgi:hypothetical protein
LIEQAEPKTFGRFDAFGGFDDCRVDHETAFSSAHATAFGGNTKLQIPSSNAMANVDSRFGVWILGFGAARRVPRAG